MKYALLVYGDSAWNELPVAEKRAFHAAHRKQHSHQPSPAGAPSVTAHYRLRPPDQTTTLRVIGNETTTAAGTSHEATARLRALYLVESETDEAVFRLAEQLPAVQAGGTVELWPLIEPGRTV